jgi:hypothetical protein
MGLMNKQYKDLIGDVHKDYKVENQKLADVIGHGFHGGRLTQEEFINKIKTDNEFANKWGVTIETKELTEDERINLLHIKHGNKGHHIEAGFNMLDEFDIPKKLIRATYKNKTIENYE